MSSDITKNPVRPLQGIRLSDLTDEQRRKVITGIDTPTNRQIAQIRRTGEDIMHGNLGNTVGNDPALTQAQYLDPGTTIGKLGDSTYDQIMIDPTEREITNVRAQSQSAALKIANGVIKLVPTAATTFIGGTVGLLMGAGKMVANYTDNDPKTGFEGIWDNELSKAMATLSDKMEEILPNYRTEYEQEHPLALDNIFSANFLGDSLIKNFGFTIGAMYSGGMITKVLSVLGNAKVAGATRMLIGSIMGAVGESTIEAVNNSKDWDENQKQVIRDMAAQDIQAAYNEYIANPTAIYTLENGERITAKEMFERKKQQIEQGMFDGMYGIEEDKAKMGNADFLLNMGILTLSNMVMFGKLFARGFKTAARLSNIRAKDPSKPLLQKIKEGAKDIYEVRGGKRAFIKDAITRSASEGLEEMSQYAASEGSGFYYRDDVLNRYLAKADPEAEQKVLSGVNATIDAIKSTLTSEQAWSEGLVGFLTGALGVPTFSRSYTSRTETWLGRGKPIGITGGIGGAYQEYKLQKQRDTELVKQMNERLQNPRFLNYYEGMVAHVKEEQEKQKAVDAGDIYSFKNHDHAQLVGDIAMFDNAGRINDFTEMIKAMVDTEDNSIGALLEASLGKYKDTAEFQGRANELAERSNEYQRLIQDAQESGDTAKEKLYLTKLQELNDEIEALTKQGEISISPFTDENGNIMDTEEIKDYLKKKREDILSAVKRYKETKRDIDAETDYKYSASQLATLTWIKSHTDNWHDRASEMTAEIKSTLFNDFATILDKYEEDEEKILNEIAENRARRREERKNAQSGEEDGNSDNQNSTQDPETADNNNEEKPKKGVKDRIKGVFSRKKKANKKNNESIPISEEEIAENLIEARLKNGGVSKIRELLNSSDPLKLAKAMHSTMLGEYLKKFIAEEINAKTSDIDNSITGLNPLELRQLFDKVEDTMRCIAAANSYSTALLDFMSNPESLQEIEDEAEKIKKDEEEKAVTDAFETYLQNHADLDTTLPKKLRAVLLDYIKDELGIDQGDLANFSDKYNDILSGLTRSSNSALKKSAKRLKRLHSYADTLADVVRNYTDDDLDSIIPEATMPKDERTRLILEIAQEINDALLKDGSQLEGEDINTPKDVFSNPKNGDFSGVIQKLIDDHANDDNPDSDRILRNKLYNDFVNAVKAGQQKADDDSEPAVDPPKPGPINPGGTTYEEVEVDWEKLLKSDNPLNYIMELLSSNIKGDPNGEIRAALEALYIKITSENNGKNKYKPDDNDKHVASVFDKKMEKRTPTGLTTENISEFDIGALKENHIAIDYNPHDSKYDLSFQRYGTTDEERNKARAFVASVQALKRELGIYKYINSGALGIAYEQSKATKKNIPLYYSLYKLDIKDAEGNSLGQQDIVILVAKREDLEKYTLIPRDSTALYTDYNGNPEYQAVGVLFADKHLGMSDAEAKANDKKIQNVVNHLTEEREKAGQENEKTFISKAYTKPSTIYSGRIAIHKEEKGGTLVPKSRSLKEIIKRNSPVFEITLGIVSNGLLAIGNNRNYPVTGDAYISGTVWLVVTGADGKPYFKALAVNSYNRSHKGKIAEEIDDEIKTLFDKNKSIVDKVKAKFRLQEDWLYFGKDHYLAVKDDTVILVNTNADGTTNSVKCDSEDALKEALEKAGIRYQVDINKINDSSYNKDIIDNDVLVTDLERVENVEGSFEVYETNWETGEPVMPNTPPPAGNDNNPSSGEVDNTLSIKLGEEDKGSPKDATFVNYKGGRVEANGEDILGNPTMFAISRLVFNLNTLKPLVYEKDGNSYDAYIWAEKGVTVMIYNTQDGYLYTTDKDAIEKMVFKNLPQASQDDSWKESCNQWRVLSNNKIAKERAQKSKRTSVKRKEELKEELKSIEKAMANLEAAHRDKTVNKSIESILTPTVNEYMKANNINSINQLLSEVPALATASTEEEQKKALESRDVCGSA